MRLIPKQVVDEQRPSLRRHSVNHVPILEGWSGTVTLRDSLQSHRKVQAEERRRGVDDVAQ